MNTRAMIACFSAYRKDAFWISEDAEASYANKGTIEAALLAGEIVHSHRSLKQRIVAGDHGDAALGHEISLPVGFGVVADGGAFGDMHVAVEDGFANTATATDADVRKQNAVVDFRIGVNAHVGRQDGVLHD